MKTLQVKGIASFQEVCRPRKLHVPKRFLKIQTCREFFSHCLHIYKNFFMLSTSPWLGASFNAPFLGLTPLPVFSLHFNKKKELEIAKVWNEKVEGIKRGVLPYIATFSFQTFAIMNFQTMAGFPYFHFRIIMLKWKSSIFGFK
jgi:hypothetical protein